MTTDTVNFLHSTGHEFIPHHHKDNSCRTMSRQIPSPIGDLEEIRNHNPCEIPRSRHQKEV